MINLITRIELRGSLQTSPYSTIGLRESLQTSYSYSQLVN